MGDFYRKKNGEKELLAKEKEGLFLDQGDSFSGEKMTGMFIIQITSSLYGG